MTTRFSLRSVSLAAAMMVAGVAGGAGVQLLHAPPPVHAATSPAPAAPVSTGAPDFARITREQGPAVVNITVSGTRKAAMVEPEGMPDDPMEFFRRFQPGAGGAAPESIVRGTGSGFIVDANGLILTNAHVVKDASEVTVKLTDRREFTAKVLGSDDKTDIAVLKIDAKDLPVARMGSTRDVQPGDWVLAIGSPFGFENTVTAGVVSAKSRSLPDGSGVSFL